MKSSSLFSALLLVGIAGTGFAATPEEDAVLAPIQAFFNGMAKRDAAAIKEPTLPGGVMVLMRDGKPSQMTFDQFAERVGKPGKTQIEERIHDPSSGSTMTSPWCGRPSTSFPMARSTTAEPIFSTW